MVTDRDVDECNKAEGTLDEKSDQVLSVLERHDCSLLPRLKVGCVISCIYMYGSSLGTGLTYMSVSMRPARRCCRNTVKFCPLVIRRHRLYCHYDIRRCMDDVKVHIYPQVSETTYICTYNFRSHQALHVSGAHCTTFGSAVGGHMFLRCWTTNSNYLS